MNRRQFIQRTASIPLLAAGTTLWSPKVLGANEKVIVGVVGCQGRGLVLSQYLAERQDVEVAYVCDVDSRLFDRAIKKIEKKQGKKPKTSMDFRRILDDKVVDALFVATPDHWHAIPTIMACQAGKDVYVEKPVAHNIWEGQKMVEAARKYQRIVQVGTQSRSGPYIYDAIDYIRTGNIGKVHLVRVFNMKYRKTIGHKKNEPVPEGVNYDMWLGPAPKRPFNPNRFHYKWHWFWDYSGGDIMNDSVHQLDIARWIIDKDYPKSAYATGGKFYFDDDQETPDTQSVLYEYDGLTMTFELTLWTPYMKKIPGKVRDGDLVPNWRYCTTRIEVYGSDGLILLGRQGGGYQVFNQDGELVRTRYGRRPTPRHLDNFFECIKSRKQPNADIEEAHKSTLLCHLGNISYLLGGRKLKFDPPKQKFIDDEEADSYLKRNYRKPWVVPEKV